MAWIWSPLPALIPPRDYMRKTAILSILALCLFLPLLGGSAYAESAPDLTYIFDSQHTLGGMLCNNDNADLPNCSDYSFVKVDVTDFSTYNYMNSFWLSPNGQSRNYTLADTTVTLIPSITRLYFDTGSGFTGSVTVTLTNSAGCPEPEPCPSCPDCSDASQFISVVIDAFWKFVIAFAGAGASLIAILLVFRYMRKVF